MNPIKKTFQKATRKLALMEALEKMKKDLQKLGPIPEGIAVYDYGVKFFNIIATFQDNNAMDIELFKNTTQDAQSLAAHIGNAGRQEFGFVRAQRGEPVSLHNLWLGDVYGLFTKPAAYWREQPEKDVQQIIQNQLSDFIQSHREPMIKLISNVLTNNKKPNNLIVKKMYQRSHGK